MCKRSLCLHGISLSDRENFLSRQLLRRELGPASDRYKAVWVLQGAQLETLPIKLLLQSFASNLNALSWGYAALSRRTSGERVAQGCCFPFAPLVRPAILHAACDVVLLGNDETTFARSRSY